MRLEGKLKGAKRQVFQHMLDTRRNKYRLFLGLVRTFKWANLLTGMDHAWARGQFLEYYYTLFRYIDDIADGDFPVPAGYSNNVEYVQARIAFAQNQVNPTDIADHLLLACSRLGEEFGEEFHQETADIMGSLLFDAQRLHTMSIFPEQTLYDHFYALDIRGTIRASLKLFGEDPDQSLALEPLGNATRIYYNIRDFNEDIAHGQVNISVEDVGRLGLDPEWPLYSGHPLVQVWFKEQAEKGMGLLSEHYENLRSAEFGWRARTALKGYVYKNKKCFRGILKPGIGK